MNLSTKILHEQFHQFSVEVLLMNVGIHITLPAFPVCSSPVASLPKSTFVTPKWLNQEQDQRFRFEGILVPSNADSCMLGIKKENEHLITVDFRVLKPQ